MHYGLKYRQTDHERNLDVCYLTTLQSVSTEWIIRKCNNTSQQITGGVAGTAGGVQWPCVETKHVSMPSITTLRLICPPGVRVEGTPEVGLLTLVSDRE